MDRIQAMVAAVDRWQRRHGWAAVAYATQKKFGNDNAGQVVVALGWYGFVAVYPLLLVLVTVLGYVGARSLGAGLVSTLHQFPVIGTDFNPARPSASLHGSPVGLVVGLLGLAYGAQGVTQTAEQAMATVWLVPSTQRGGFPVRLARSFGGLAVIGATFVLDAAASTYATAGGTAWPLRVVVLAGLLATNALLYLLAFAVLTPGRRSAWGYLPGALVGGIGFTALVTVGTGLLQHQIRNSSATYGQFGVVIGLVAVLFLLAKISLYGAELNPVLADHLWPRALRSSDPTTADRRALAAQAATLPKLPAPASGDEAPAAGDEAPAAEVRAG